MDEDQLEQDEILASLLQVEEGYEFVDFYDDDDEREFEEEEIPTSRKRANEEPQENETGSKKQHIEKPQQNSITTNATKENNITAKNTHSARSNNNNVNNNNLNNNNLNNNNLNNNNLNNNNFNNNNFNNNNFNNNNNLNNHLNNNILNNNSIHNNNLNNNSLNNNNTNKNSINNSSTNNNSTNNNSTNNNSTNNNSINSNNINNNNSISNNNYNNNQNTTINNAAYFSNANNSNNNNRQTVNSRTETTSYHDQGRIYVNINTHLGNNGNVDVTMKLDHNLSAPSFVPPPHIKDRLKDVDFVKRVCLDILISNEELSWPEVEEDVLPVLDFLDLAQLLELLEAKCGRRCKEERFRDLKNLLVADGFTMQRNKNEGLIVHMYVSHTGITFRGPVIAPKHRAITEFGGDMFIFATFRTITGRHSAVITGAYRHVLKENVLFAGRKYEWLACSASQLREKKCYFFAANVKSIDKPDASANISCADVRNWMGDFSSITNVAKYGARLGQAFSRVTPTITVEYEDVTILEDIKRRGYCFTDGYGEISHQAALQISRCLNLPFVPSGFQIRYGPMKGVVVQKPRELRSGMTSEELKCDALDLILQAKNEYALPEAAINQIIGHMTHPEYGQMTNTAEIVDRTIEILKDSAISDDVTYEIVGKIISILDDDRAQTERESKVLVLRESMKKYEIPHPTASQKKIEVIKYSRFHSRAKLNFQFILLFYSLGVPEDYFFKLLSKSMRNNTQGTRIRDDEERDEAFKIHVPDATLVLGVVDPRGYLKENEVFIQVGRREKQVITGVVAVAKSPCLHPGDIRLLNAVDRPELHHLQNLLVLSTLGRRPAYDEIAGSDVDGDQFFVTWDKVLTDITPFPPASYLFPQPNQVFFPKDDIVQAVKENFLDCLQPPVLTQISNYHLEYADRLGAKHPDCIELAVLFSRAIDAPKTGDRVMIPPKYYVKKWPHFMPHMYGDKQKSEGILGKIYDKWQKIKSRQ
eukprot:Phypoly_transcript_01465.p1 GENE.Phypoly_transcript_01465~~Phypoly_transcript_01465.p1  ORF type:complete len:986 (+),score=181.68 Phypoly_transcript_01465:229-3186(+)